MALLLGAFLFLVYNANGREIGAADTQPATFVAREIALRGTVRLDRVVERYRLFARRPSFSRDGRGHWRSSYPILPALFGGVVAATLHQSGLVDLEAPLAPNLVATLTASALTAAAVSLVFLSLMRLTSPRLALVVAVGLGLGTNYWTLASRTIWQHETVAFGLALALWAGAATGSGSPIGERGGRGAGTRGGGRSPAASRAARRDSAGADLHEVEEPNGARSCGDRGGGRRVVDVLELLLVRTRTRRHAATGIASRQRASRGRFVKYTPLGRRGGSPGVAQPRTPPVQSSRGDRARRDLATSRPAHLRRRASAQAAVNRRCHQSIEPAPCACMVW